VPLVDPELEEPEDPVRRELRVLLVDLEPELEELVPELDLRLLSVLPVDPDVELDDLRLLSVLPVELDFLVFFFALVELCFLLFCVVVFALLLFPSAFTATPSPATEPSLALPDWLLPAPPCFFDDPPPSVVAAAAAPPATSRAMAAAISSRFERQRRRIETVLRSDRADESSVGGTGGATAVKSGPADGEGAVSGLASSVGGAGAGGRVAEPAARIVSGTGRRAGPSASLVAVSLAVAAPPRVCAVSSPAAARSAATSSRQVR
jgi:hypothetical protein